MIVMIADRAVMLRIDDLMERMGRKEPSDFWKTLIYDEDLS